MTYSHLGHFMYFDYYFSQGGYKAFYSCVIAKGVDMLPKRSTHVDQNFWSESIDSQLSVAIFRVLRNLLGTWKSLIYKKKSKNYRTHNQPILLVTFWRDISRNTLTRCPSWHVHQPFWDVFYHIEWSWVIRRSLGALKIAIESWESILSDSKFWSTSVDLLGNKSSLVKYV